MGPAQVIKRKGENSYQVRVKPGWDLDVHVDQVKPYISDDISSKGVNFHFQIGTPQLPWESFPEIERIRAHRVVEGHWELLTHWKGTSEADDVWEPLNAF